MKWISKILFFFFSLEARELVMIKLQEMVNNDRAREWDDRKKTQRAQSKYYSESNVKVKKLLKNLMCGIFFYSQYNIKFIISSLARRIRLVKILAHTQYTRHIAYFLGFDILFHQNGIMCFHARSIHAEARARRRIKWRPPDERIRVIWT